MFKLIYQENANKDPIVRKLQAPASKYIELLEKIQTNNQVLYGSGLAVAQLISTLSDRDYEISKIKKLYNSNWELADGLFKDYWMMAIDLVNLVSQEVDNMTALGRVRNTLEAEYGMRVNDPMLIKKHIFEDDRYRTIARNVMDAQHRFKKTNNQRVKCVNELLTELNSLLALERALIGASERHNSLNAYDMTVNQQHLKRVVQNLKGHAELVDDLIDKLEEYHGRLDKLEDNIHDIEAEFRRANGSDPNFYDAVAPATTYEELFYIGRNAQKSLDIEIQNLRREIEEMERKDKRLKQKDHLLILNHPRTLGLSAAKKTAEDLMKRNVKDTTLLVTEIADCMKKEGDEVDFCVSHLRAVKDVDVKKLQSHIDYIRHQQLATGNLAKYAKLMFALHSQRRKLIEKEDLLLMDKHKLEQNKKLADLIAARATMDAKIKENISKRNVIENMYAKSLSQETNTQDKQLNKVMERIIDNNNQVSRVLYELDQQQRELNNANTGPSGLFPVSTSDTENIRKQLDEQLSSDVKIGNADNDVSLPLSVYKDAYLDIARHGTSPWNDVFANQDSTDPNLVGAVKEFDKTYIQGLSAPKTTGTTPEKVVPKDYFGSQENFPTSTSQSDGFYFTPEAVSRQVSPPPQAGGSSHKALKRYLREKLNEAGHGGFKEAQDYFKGGYKKAHKKKSHQQTGGAGLALVVAKHHSLAEYTKVLDELIAEKRNKLLSKLTIGPSQSVKVERFKIDLVLHKRREEILKNYLEQKGIAFVNTLEKINKRIDTEYIMNALFADIGAYQRQHKLVKKISDEFDFQNSVVMKVFAVVIRLVAPDSQEAKDLHEAEAKFQAKVRTMTMHSEKINVLCHPSNINLLEVVKDVDASVQDKDINVKGLDAERDATKQLVKVDEYVKKDKDGKEVMNARGHAQSCAVAISHFDKLVRDLVQETSDFLSTMNKISIRAIMIERGQMYDSVNITIPASMNWAFNQVSQNKADVLAEIRAYITQYAKASYSAHEYVRSTLMTSSDYYFDTKLDVEAKVIKEQLDDNSQLRKDLASEYNKLKVINDKIKELINATGDFNRENKTVAERVLLLDMTLKQRAHQLNVINNILLNVDNLLNRHRMISEQNAEHRLKKLYAQQMLDGVWKSLAVLQYDIDEKLTRMNALSIAFNKVASNNDVNQRFRDFTGKLNETVNALLNLWKTVKEGLLETFGENNNIPTPAQLGGQASQDSKISQAYNLQVQSYPSFEKIKSVMEKQREALQTILQGSLQAMTHAERLQKPDGTDNEKLELAKYLANIVAPIDSRGDHKDSVHLLTELKYDISPDRGYATINKEQFATRLSNILQRQYPLDKLTLFLFQVIVKVQEVCATNALSQAVSVIISEKAPEKRLVYPLARGSIRRVELPVQNLVNVIRNYSASLKNPEFGEFHLERIAKVKSQVEKITTELFKDTNVIIPVLPDLTFPLDEDTPSDIQIDALKTEVENLIKATEENLKKLTDAINTLADQKYCKYDVYRVRASLTSADEEEELNKNPIVEQVKSQLKQLTNQFNNLKDNKLPRAKYLVGPLEVLEHLIAINDAVCSLANNLQQQCQRRIIDGFKIELARQEQQQKLAEEKAKAQTTTITIGSPPNQPPPPQLTLEQQKSAKQTELASKIADRATKITERNAKETEYKAEQSKRGTSALLRSRSKPSDREIELETEYNNLVSEVNTLESEINELNREILELDTAIAEASANV